MQPERANEFQSAILEGNFDEAILLLPRLIQSHHAFKQVAHPVLHQHTVVFKCTQQFIPRPTCFVGCSNIGLYSQQKSAELPGTHELQAQG